MSTDPGMLKENDINAAWLGSLTLVKSVEEEDVINSAEQELDLSFGSRGNPEITSLYLPAYVKLAVYLRDVLYPWPLFHTGF